MERRLGIPIHSAGAFWRLPKPSLKPVRTASSSSSWRCLSSRVTALGSPASSRAKRAATALLVKRRNVNVWSIIWASLAGSEMTRRRRAWM